MPLWKMYEPKCNATLAIRFIFSQISTFLKDLEDAGEGGGIFNQMIFVESINKKDSPPIRETKAIQSYKKC